ALLRPHLAANRLLGPEVAAIRSRDTAGVCSGIVPSWRPLKLAVLVNDPFPRDVAPLARLFEQAVDPLHFRTSHRRDQAGSEQLVSDAAAGDRVCGFGCGVHRLDKIEGPPRHTATFFGTGFKIPGVVGDAAH